MASSSLITITKTKEEEEEEHRAYHKYTAMAATLPSRKDHIPSTLYKYQNFWYVEHFLYATMAMHDTFRALPTDILLATPPKSGTTWLKAIVFAVTSRSRYPIDDRHPLLTANPHDCVPFLHSIYENNTLPYKLLDSLPRPRLLATHVPWSILPASVSESGCRVVYLCRDPKDTFVSFWNFLKQIFPGPSDVEPLEESFEMFCSGYCTFGPIWEHILEYWNESLLRPEKVLFLKYEDLMAAPVIYVKRLAEFLGFPFTEEEVEEGVVEEIIRLCSFEKLRNLEVNKNGVHGSPFRIKNAAFFGKGKIGSWKEQMTPEMAQKLDAITASKLHGSGLTFCRADN